MSSRTTIDEFKDTIDEFKDAAEQDIGHTTAHLQRRHCPPLYRQSLEDTWKLLAEEEAIYNKEEDLIEEEQATIDQQRQIVERKRRLLVSRRKLIQRKRGLLDCEQNQGSQSPEVPSTPEL